MLSEVMLIALIQAACVEFAGHEAKVACYENVVNCAITDNGKIEKEKAYKCLRERAVPHE